MRKRGARRLAQCAVNSASSYAASVQALASGAAKTTCPPLLAEVASASEIRIASCGLRKVSAPVTADWGWAPSARIRRSYRSIAPSRVTTLR
jgi:hypothetical protein